MQKTVSGLWWTTLQSCQGPGCFCFSSCYPDGFFPRLCCKMTVIVDFSHRLPYAYLPRSTDSLTSYSSFLRARKRLYPNPQQASLSKHLIGPKWLEPTHYWIIFSRGLRYIIGLHQWFSNFLALGHFYTFKNYWGLWRILCIWVNYIYQNHTWELLT